LIPKESASVLKPLTALGHQEAESVILGPFTLTERFDLALASVAVRRGRDKDLAKAAKTAGLPLPALMRAETGAPYSAFWMTPDMWMVEAPMDSHEDIAAILKSALGDSASVTEQSDAWVRFDIAAPDLSPLMERLSNIDLAAQPTGYASRTVIEHLAVYLIKRSASEVTLYGPRASAQSLLHTIEVTAKSVL
jgi:sarcosine oxidase subunit gamma